MLIAIFLILIIRILSVSTRFLIAIAH